MTAPATKLVYMVRGINLPAGLPMSFSADGYENHFKAEQAIQEYFAKVTIGAPVGYTELSAIQFTIVPTYLWDSY